MPDATPLASDVWTGGGKSRADPAVGIVQVERFKWKVMIPDAVPAYITWERYLANQERLASNRYLPTTPGVPRGGPSLLSGVVYCGRCGRRMRVAYHAHGTPVYYLCKSRAVACAEPVCQSFAGKNLETLIATEVLRAIEPARFELHERALADLERERQRLDKHWQQRLERARIEADRAARQYHAIEPENRLVARELERRWETSPTGATGTGGAVRSFPGRTAARTDRDGPPSDRGTCHGHPGLWQHRAPRSRNVKDHPLPGRADNGSRPRRNRMGRRDNPLGRAEWRADTSVDDRFIDMNN